MPGGGGAVVCGVALVLAQAAALAAPAIPKFHKGIPYAHARAELLRRGWTPVKATAPGCEPGREDVCAAYPETQSCAGTGFGLCSFDFRSRSGQMTEVVTHGGNVRGLTVSEVIECRSAGCD